VLTEARDPVANPAELVESCFVLDVGFLDLGAGWEGAFSIRGPAAWELRVDYMLSGDDGRIVRLLGTTPLGTGPHADVALSWFRIVSGGERRYLHCPGLPGRPKCGARVAKLYWPLFGTQAFGCRACHELVYRSTRERPRTLHDLWRLVGRPLADEAAVARAMARNGRQVRLAAG
jgi:hypothetical protein